MNVGNLSEWMMSVPPWFWYVLLGLAVVTLVLFEIIMAQRYRRLTEVAEKRPLHAPVSIRGFISKEMDSRGATEYLHGQFREISETYRKMREKHGFLNTPVAIGKEFAQMMELASASLNLDPSEHPFYDDPSESRPDRTIEEDLKGIKLKSPWFEASASAIVNLVWRLIQKVPVRHSKRYRSLLFHVSVVSAGNRTQLRVSRQNRSALARSDANPADPVRSRNGQLTFTFSTEVEPADILRNAAFMVLELHGKAFPGLNWKGLRNLTDGLEHLDAYRRTGNQSAFHGAKESFRRAVEEDPNQYESCCFLGSMLVADRKQDAIKSAMNYFKQALKTDRRGFRAFIHAGLAHCYAQQFHRLAKRTPEVLRMAQQHAQDALQDWEKERGSESTHPWIVYTGGLVRIVDEAVGRSPEEAKKQFIPAAELFLKAIQGEQDNALFHNTLGWLLLKLVERGVDEIKPDDEVSKELTGNAAEISERYFQRSLDLSTSNKLTHANLCLLYATSHFRLKDREKYLRKCHAHGLDAVKIDPGYINGYRDLAVSLLKYREDDKAYEFYEKALLHADKIDKDLEIIEDVMKVVEELELSEEQKERWRNPDPKLLEPPQTGP